MFKWLKKFPWSKIVFSSILFMVIAFVLRQFEAILTMKYYLMPEYFSIWSKVMMPKAGPPPASFMYTSLLVTFLSGFAYAYIYAQVKESLPKAFWTRVFCYADILVAASLVTFILPTYLMFNVPMGLLVSWFISSFVISILGSIVFVKMIK